MYQQTGSIKDIAGDFTDILKHIILLFHDEANNASEAKYDGAIKVMITEPSLRIRAMYSPTVFQPNFLRVVFATNKITGIPTEKCKRRFMLIGVDKRKDQQYYNELVRMVEAHDYAALYLFADFLYHLNIGDWMSDRTPVMTELAQKILVNHLDSVGNFLLYSLDKGAHIVLAFSKDRENQEMIEKMKTYDSWDELYLRYLANTGGGASQDEEEVTTVDKLNDVVTKQCWWYTYVNKEEFYKLYQSWSTTKAHYSAKEIPLPEDFFNQVLTYFPHAEIVREPADAPVGRIQEEYIKLGYLDLCRLSFAHGLGLNPSRWWKNKNDVRNCLRYPFDQNFPSEN